MNIRKIGIVQHTPVRHKHDTKVVNLFESDTSVDNLQEKKIEQVFDVKSKQFQFDSGVIMGALNSDLDDMLFGLKEHAKRTRTYEEFQQSVETFLLAVPAKLTTSDLTRLKEHYNKYIK